MPTPAMQLIQTITVGSGGAASIEFTGIPGTATDLLVTWSLRSTDTSSAWQQVIFRINDSSSSIYSSKALYGIGNATASSNDTNSTSFTLAWGNGGGATSNTFGNASLYIPDYAGSQNKSVSFDGVTETNSTNAIAFMGGHAWANTAAVTSLKMSPSGYNWAQYSTASLYTITKGSGGATVS